MKLDSIAELSEMLGAQVRRVRLQQGIDQASLATKASIALSAVQSLESGRGVSLKTLIAVLRTLEREDWLLTLAPEPSVSPMQLLLKKPARQRAYAPKQKKGNTNG